MSDVAAITRPPRATAADGPLAAEAAAYTVVRLAALCPAADPPEAAALRAAVQRWVELQQRDTQLADRLADALHDRASDVAPELRRVLLPLRRDVHNHRSPRPALRAELAESGFRTDLLTEWLAGRDELDRLAAQVAAATEPALAAERRVLAQACRDEGLRRAVALTGTDLLRAVDRAAALADAPDKRARKSEPNVLRYVSRAVTKTSPLSWFTWSAWGRWAERTDDLDGPPDLVARSEADRSYLDALLRTVDITTEYRLEPAARPDGPRLLFRRGVPAGEFGQVIQREEEVAVPLTPVLRFVIEQCAAGRSRSLPDLVRAVASRLPLEADEAQRVAGGYVGGLVAQGLLQPALPLDPQAEDPVAQAAGWLAGAGAHALAQVLSDIGTASADLAAAPADERPDRLARLRTDWDAAFAAAGASVPARRMPVTEDVTVRGVLRIGPDAGSEARRTVAALQPLFEVFDLFTVIRRAVRDRFVAKYGAGGRCASIAEFAVDYGEAWRDGELVGPGSVAAATRSLGAGLDELAGLRRRLSAMAPRPTDADEIVVPDDLLTAAADELPHWVTARPASYAVFGQPAAQPGGTVLCVNQIYGGWGRFTSRFLPAFGAAARREVAAQIQASAGADAALAQVRPVGGFNANVHPMLVADEVSDQAGPGRLSPAELELVHDPDADQLRIRHRPSGRLLDLLYLGFLVPVALPERLGPLLNDLGTGLVDVRSPLLPNLTRETAIGPVTFRPRLRFRDVVLARRRWELTANQVTQWRTELDAAVDAPNLAAARWRVATGLPEQVFVSGAAAWTGADLTALLDYLDAPKPQYVDLGSALHARCLSRTLARYPNGVVIEEALPAPVPGRRRVEFVVETYRRAR